MPASVASILIMSIDQPGLPSTEASTNPPDPGGAPATSMTTARSLAPDLARGAMLLLIAVANAWGHLYGRAVGLGYRPLAGTSLDSIVDTVVAFAVDDRSRPMFAILYGYGIATMAARMAARGADRRQVRSVLRRRSLGLLALGALHAALLFSGDILGIYGAIGLVALLLVDRRRATLVRWGWVSFGLMLAGSTGLTLLALAGPSEPVVTADTYLASVPERLVEWSVTLMLSTMVLFVLNQVVLGILLARSGWIDRPVEHRTQLARVGVGALVVNLLANLPWALAVGGVWRPEGAMVVVLDVLHVASGVMMGLGYICLIAWAAARLTVLRAATGSATTRVTGWVAAVGRRSLTCYLLQSALMAPVLAAWGLGYGGTWGTATATGFAVGVWAVTVLVAVALERAGRRGPFEVVLRRITYGRPRAMVPAAPSVTAAQPVPQAQAGLS